MYTFMAILRSAYLLFVAGYAVQAVAPLYASVAGTFDEQYARCSRAQHELKVALLLSIAWIALETLVGWILVRHARRRARAARLAGAVAAAATGSPPPAAP